MSRRSGGDEVDPGPGASAASRTRRVWLPSGRSLIGGVLIAVAALGVLLAHRSASDPPSTRFVVAARDVPAGTTLSSEHLGLVAAELPAGTTAVPAAEVDQLIGRVTRVPITTMDLLRQRDVLEAGRFTSSTAVEVELDLPPAQALAGTIREGDRVDVLSTDGDGSGTVAVARDAVVTLAAGEGPDDGIGGLGTVRIRLSLADDAAAAAVVDAAVRTDVTLTLPGPGMEGSAP